MYMFYGGINFGFMVGVNYFEGFYYKFDVISYGMYMNIQDNFFVYYFFFLVSIIMLFLIVLDYDVLLLEVGDIILKYMRVREIILEKGLKFQGNV